MAYRRTRAQSAASRQNARRAQLSRVGRRSPRMPAQYRILRRKR